jgi:hypothetical protein
MIEHQICLGLRGEETDEADMTIDSPVYKDQSLKHESRDHSPEADICMIWFGPFQEAFVEVLFRMILETVVGTAHIRI